MTPDNILFFDFEWRISDLRLYCASFVDMQGKEKVIHESEFTSYSNFLQFINFTILDYQYSAGYNSTGEMSDLAVLNYNCAKAGVPSIVDVFNGKDGGKIYSVSNREHIDIFLLYKKQMIRGYVFDNAYRSLKLKDVAKAVLGKGKYKGYVGKDAEKLPIPEVKAYCLHDSIITRDLALAKNGEVLDLMNAISELCKIPFSRAVNGTITTYWGKVLDDENAQAVYNPIFRCKERYKGGNVYDPKVGKFYNIKVVDVASLYPSMVVNYNLSFETINCDCCPHNRLPDGVITKDYWFCKRQPGIFARKQAQFMKERLIHKNEGRKTKADGLKILINGGYGTMGSKYFRYSDFRIAELTTATARYTQRKMAEFAPEYGFIILGGDTDSLFFDGDGDVQGFLERCKKDLNVTVEFEKLFEIVFFTKKKHYFGKIKGKDKPVIKGMEFKKSDRPAWINETGLQFVKDVLAEIDPMPNLRKAILEDLLKGKVPIENLKFSVRLSKDPNLYDKNCPQKRVGLLAGAKGGEVVEYYKAKKGETFDPAKLDYNRYKDALLDSGISDVLDILGINYKELAVNRRPEIMSMDAFFAQASLG